MRAYISSACRNVVVPSRVKTGVPATVRGAPGRQHAVHIPRRGVQARSAVHTHYTFLHATLLTCLNALTPYSFKKAANADLVLTVVCSEQDLAQQKVALAMSLLNPAMSGRQYHVSYDLVRLPSGRMSGRRGRYLLADDLYDELKARLSLHAMLEG